MDLQTLTVDDVTRIHARLVEDFSETDTPILPAGIKSMALLESAVHRQHTGIGGILKYPSAVENAATLTYGICCDHPFHNGNKRTALVAMLVHLDRNKLSLYGVGQRDLFDLIIKVASHSLLIRKRHRGGHMSSSDEEVKALTRWIRENADKIVRGERPIIYRELRRILSRFDFHLENPKGNQIEVVKYEAATTGFFSSAPQVKRKHVASIGYPGENLEVALKVIKQVRTICRLREEDGVDSASFYDDTIVLDSFINRYRSILRRLANR